MEKENNLNGKFQRKARYDYCTTISSHEISLMKFNEFCHFYLAFMLGRKCVQRTDIEIYSSRKCNACFISDDEGVLIDQLELRPS